MRLTLVRLVRLDGDRVCLFPIGVTDPSRNVLSVPDPVLPDIVAPPDDAHGRLDDVYNRTHDLDISH